MPALHLSAAAEDDLAAIARYIGAEKQSPRAARDLIDAFYEKCGAYARQPEMGEPRSDLDEDLRSFTFKRNYVVIYRPIPGGIDVLRVFHGARNYTGWFRGGETWLAAVSCGSRARALRIAPVDPALSLSRPRPP